jgi:hypothetical protein
MGDVVQMPMTWADAFRLVANEIGMSGEDFAHLVNEAETKPESSRADWLSDRMMLAARKNMMRTLPTGSTA